MITQPLITAALVGAWLGIELWAGRNRHHGPPGPTYFDLMRQIGVDDALAADAFAVWGPRIMLFDNQLLGSYIGDGMPHYSTYITAGYYLIVSVEYKRVVLRSSTGTDRDFACLPSDLASLVAHNLDQHAMGVTP